MVPTVWFPKGIEDGFTWAMPLLLTPVPDRETFVGDVGASLVMVNCPVNDFAESGEKATEYVAVAPGASACWTLPDTNWNSGGVTSTRLMFSVAVPVLVTVTDCAGLVVPTVWLPKPRELGETEIAGEDWPEKPELLAEEPPQAQRSRPKPSTVKT